MSQAQTVDGQILSAVVDGVTDVSASFEGRTRRLLADCGLDEQPLAGRTCPSTQSSTC